MPSRLLLAPLRTTSDDSDVASVDSDWEQGRTLVPPDDDEDRADAEEEAYMSHLADSIAGPFERKNAEHKRLTLAALEPALDFVAASHAHLALHADKPFLNGLKTFNDASGAVHGNVAHTKESLTSTAASTHAELSALLTKLHALYKKRKTLVDEFTAHVAAAGDAALADLDLLDADIDKAEQDAEKREKEVMKKNAKDNTPGGVAKFKALLNS
ncbi:hypothetical protein EXIGLDRAFT_838043 [Exidia glandulosa HHB12029]|uniref:Uncharacterized protein n=1 Tax=Exidia glandulosa HHB12029 TaxID=1314781 RepID=A0A165G7N1_EXIGL|nr:hypothetical protein EXIGLDRAFT_838043 [Exidia glandulosa HHB12029]